MALPPDIAFRRLAVTQLIAAMTVPANPAGSSWHLIEVGEFSAETDVSFQVSYHSVEPAPAGGYKTEVLKVSVSTEGRSL